MINSEIVLIIVILAQLAYIGISQYYNIKEREKLIKLVKAKDLQEITTNEAVSKQPKKVIQPESLDDLVPMTADNDILFDKAIKKTLDDANKLSSISKR